MTHVSHDQGLWFNNHVEIVVAQRDGADGLSGIRMTLPFDKASPLHVHHEEDEVLHVLDGEVRFSLGVRMVTKRSGDTLLAPPGMPHGFRVLSRTGARMLIVTRGGFEAMVRATSRPAVIAGLPTRSRRRGRCRWNSRARARCAPSRSSGRRSREPDRQSTGASPRPGLRVPDGCAPQVLKQSAAASL